MDDSLTLEKGEENFMTALKDCPFCGATPISGKNSTSKRLNARMTFKIECDNYETCLICPSICVSWIRSNGVPESEIEAAIKAWNQRFLK